MISEDLAALAEMLERYERKGVSLDAEYLANVLVVIRQAAEDARELELREIPEASRLPPSPLPNVLPFRRRTLPNPGPGSAA